VFIHDSLGIGWGFSIVVLTIIVRAALLPLTYKSMRSIRQLAHLQPEMKKLQEKYKGDKERLNQEMMKFYRENKVNPFASCLPMLAQFPVFIALFWMLRVDLRYDICPDINPPTRDPPVACGADSPGAGFLFIPDLTAEATGWVLLVLVVLYVGSQLASTLLSMTTADRTQRIIFMALPFVFVPFIINFPAGLLVYWITTNLGTIVQGLIIKRSLGPMPKPDPDSKGLFGALSGARAATEPADGRSKAATKTTAKVGGGDEPRGRPSSRPPAPPRKKKKRSGRRR
jgi:YidC/Oxa1 family membrane protein insertase